MRIPLTNYGWPQVLIFPAAVLALMAVWLVIGLMLLPGWAVCLTEAAPLIVLIWVMSFFRDPYRIGPIDKKLLLSPADGKITDIETTQENEFIGGPALRIGIFLSIFNVHINRSPCNARIEKITYKKGLYKDARDPTAGQVNESNDIFLLRTDNPQDKLLLRQISGAVARRIVCAAREGQQLAGGEKFGMIKFGSRTELYLPVRENLKTLVKTGDKVKAGLSPLARYDPSTGQRSSQTRSRDK